MAHPVLSHAPVIGRRRGIVAERIPAWQDLTAPLTGFGTVVGLGAASGGYFPREWGWSTLSLLWIAALALLVRRHVHLSVLEVAMLGALSGLAAWIALSISWSADPSQSVLEAQRALVYVAGLLAVLLLMRRAAVPHLLGAVLVAVVVVSAYGLATRLFPERLGEYDSIAGYRLDEPLGYWNGVGIFAAMGALLAVGLAARARHRVTRAVAASSLVLLAPTLYFTFGRGPWIALALGLAAAVALSPRRLHLITTVLVVAPAPALAVWLASQSEALTRQESPLAEASREGHRLAFTLLLLAVVSGVATFAFTKAESRLKFGRRARLAYAGVLLLIVVVGLLAVFARYGGPSTLAARGYEAFKAPPPAIDGDLSKRLFSFSGNNRAANWSIARQQASEHPFLGSGAGSYEQSWMRHRPTPHKVRDAHNLYLETLAELGPLGVLLLLTTLATPLVAASKVRRHPLVPAAVGAYVAYLVHAGVDWDWELPVVTLTALFCGAAVLVAARRDEKARRTSTRVRVGALVVTLALAAFAFVGLMGHSALASSEEAAERNDLAKAASEARKATHWMPWSPAPWEQLADVQVEIGDPAAARTSLRRAIAKDERDWSLWLDLARISAGSDQRRLLARALQLNPLSPRIAEFRAEIRLQASKEGS